ncbi:MAG: dienelactone hydrolase family protein [Planctomycetaceae bacterium]|nr:dienelactone hydrolase family protein [Planctomycetaceae bacterium]
MAWELFATTIDLARTQYSSPILGVECGGGRLNPKDKEASMNKPNYLHLAAVLAALGAVLNCRIATAQFDRDSTAQPRYHTPPASGVSLMKDQHLYSLVSPLRSLKTPDSKADVREWKEQLRPQLHRQWENILGKLQPSESDQVWFGDIRKSTEISRIQKDGYVRIELTLPMETDFDQSYLLLLPDNVGTKKCPAVIAWTSTSPDYTEPEKWWGEWLAQHGYVVLCGWSFIRNYRDATSYRNDVQLKLYERFGRWAPISRMVFDVQREAQFLADVPIVDPNRIGFMGFSLSAKTALYVAAFAPEIKAVVSIDPHLALYGNSNYLDPWYLDAKRPFDSIPASDYPVEALRNTVWSLLDTDPTRPGFERNHHELLALAAPRAVMVIGCSTDQPTAAHSDDRQSIAYINAAREVYELLDVPEKLEYIQLTCGHRATDPVMDRSWQRFFERWLKEN